MTPGPHEPRPPHEYVVIDEVHHWSDDVELKIVNVPMLDTGLGREAGFRDDAHMIEVAEAERAAMPAWERELHEQIDQRLSDAFMYGDDQA